MRPSYMSRLRKMKGEERREWLDLTKMQGLTSFNLLFCIGKIKSSWNIENIMISFCIWQVVVEIMCRHVACVHICSPFPIFWLKHAHSSWASGQMGQSVWMKDLTIIFPLFQGALGALGAFLGLLVWNCPVQPHFKKHFYTYELFKRWYNFWKGLHELRKIWKILSEVFGVGYSSSCGSLNPPSSLLPLLLPLPDFWLCTR